MTVNTVKIGDGQPSPIVVPDGKYWVISAITTMVGQGIWVGDGTTDVFFREDCGHVYVPSGREVSETYPANGVSISYVELDNE